MADDFIKKKFDWLDQVAGDRKLSAEAFRLAYLLASGYLNRGTGDAWPGQTKLAAQLGLGSPRSIKHLIDQLAARRHLHVTVGRGRGHSNHYKPLLWNSGGDNESEPAEAPSMFADVEDAAPAHPRRASDTDIEFEKWWLQYPRKVAKDAALRAYRRAIEARKATHETLIIGAMRYSAERSEQDPKFTKHPATWLNGGCWKDEAAPRAAAPTGAPQVSRPTGALSAITGVADWLSNQGDEA